MGVGGQNHAPAALPPGKTRYPLYVYTRLDGPPGTVQTGALTDIVQFSTYELTITALQTMYWK
jgi:hypothetical protein